MRLAVWSGPRNLSTALMYAFAQREGAHVWDEPFYAAYLAQTGIDHPMREAVIAAGETDPAAVARRCAQVGGYQKHMALHMRPGFPLDFMETLANAFLIRHPARVIASYHAKREDPTPDDLGARRLAELFDHARSLAGKTPVVIDGDDVRRNPRAALALLCEALGLAFSEAMLRWPAGGHPADGVWAPHWYGAVHRSTGLQAQPLAPLPDVPVHLRPVLDEALPHYEALRAHALKVPE